MKKLVGAVIAVSALVGWAAPAGAATPKLIVNPNSGLHDNQTVHLTQRHGTPGQEYVAAECNRQFPAGGQDDCTQIALGTNATSTLKFKGRVHIGEVGTIGGIDGYCGPSFSCVVAVMPLESGQWQVASAVSVPISFA